MIFKEYILSLHLKVLILQQAMKGTQKITAGRELKIIQALVYPLYMEDDVT